MKALVKPLTAIVVLVVLTWIGCTQEDTPGPNQTDARTKFLGQWMVNETWTDLTYEVTITSDPNSSNGVFIKNFGNVGNNYPPAGASVNGNNIYLDPDQVIGDGIIINGSGSMSGTTKINWGYTMNDGATLITATAVYAKL
jgi:hypothetical protein